jgi:hypothetical protein
MKGRELTNWAKHQREMIIDSHFEILNSMLHPGLRFKVLTKRGELKLLAEGIPLIDGIFLSENDASFISAQWRHKLRQTNVTEKFSSKNLINSLLRLRKTKNIALKKQVIEIDREIQFLEKEIVNNEQKLNSLIFQLTKLSEKEINLVEMENKNYF